MSLSKYHYILLNYYINILSIIYLCIVYSAYAASQMCTIVLFVSAPAASVFRAVKVPLTSIYASL